MGHASNTSAAPNIDHGYSSTVPGVGQYLPDGNFVLWREEPGEPGKKPRKVPVHPDGRRHSAQAPQPRHSLAEAARLAASTGFRVGYRIPAGSGIVCLDLDNCVLPDGTETPAAALARTALAGAVIERSVSGTGLHFWSIAHGCTNTGAKSHPTLGDFDLIADDQKFIALGRWESGTGPLPDRGEVLTLLVPQGGPQDTRQAIQPGDWHAKTDQQRAECLADLRSALAHAYNPDSRDDWIAAGQALASLGEDGRATWSEWSATSTAYPGGSGLDRWDTFAGDRSDYRSIFARAQRAGWKQPRRTPDPATVFAAGAFVPPADAGSAAGAGTAGRYATTGDIRDGFGDVPPLTFPGNAQRVTRAYGDRLRWVQDAEAWFLWDGSRWVRMDEAVLIALLAGKLPAAIYSEALRVAHPDAMRHFPDWARKSGDPAAVRKVLELLRGVPAHRERMDTFDADAYLIGFDGARQVVDLRTGRVRPAAIGDHVTRSCAVAEVGAPSEAIRFSRFLEEVTCGDAELSEWLRRWLGYCLTGSTREHAFAFLYGDGRNGKSVLTEIMLALLGTYAATIRPAALCSSGLDSASAPTPELARLDGVRLLVSPEAEEGSRFAEAQLKALTAGDTVQVRALYGAPRDLVPRLKLTITGNHRPAVAGQDAGIWRRVRLVPFRAQFDGPQCDPDLRDKLTAEGPHVLAWLVESARDYLRHGLPRCRAIEAATEDYRDQQDALGDFLADHCTKGGETTSGEVFRAYQAWCALHGVRHSWTQKALTIRLTDYRRNGWHITSRRTSKARLLAGVTVQGPFGPP